ncbi:MAG: TlpA family protein disulfide reductase [Streptosporangiales bacterium]
MRRRVRLAASFAGILALVACGAGTPSGGPSHTSSHPSKTSVSVAPSLVAKADLAPCPSTKKAGAGTSGKRLPAVTVPCLGKGPAVRLGALRGPMVINLWATWCGPCREEVPVFQKLHESAGSRVPVLGIDFQDTSPEAALSFLVDAKAHYPSVFDGSGDTQAAVGSSGGLPVTLFVDRSGRITHRKVGPYTSLHQLEADVRAHLDG